MKCIVTAGPTYEPLDHVRRLTNFSTGSLGSLLALALSENFPTTLLRSVCAVYPQVSFSQKGSEVIAFSTPQDLLEKFSTLSVDEPCAIFHAAAVNDFGFGRVYEKLDNGSLQEIHSTKFSTRSQYPLLAELISSPKILPQLRQFFPSALIVGWKYETQTQGDELLQKARSQLSDCKSDLCIVNGPAYGEGFGILSKNNPGHFLHIPRREELFLELCKRTQDYQKETPHGLD